MIMFLLHIVPLGRDTIWKYKIPVNQLISKGKNSIKKRNSKSQHTTENILKVKSINNKPLL
jgi:hypothetical protein